MLVPAFLLGKYCSKANLTVTYEEKYLVNNRPYKRPADITIDNLPEGKRTLIDVGVTNPLRLGEKGHLMKVSATKLYSSDEYRKIKTDQFTKLDTLLNLLFKPFIVETFGALGKDETDFIKLIAKRAAPRVGLGPSEIANFLYQRISSLCMIFAARGVLLRMTGTKEL